MMVVATRFVPLSPLIVVTTRFVPLSPLIVVTTRFVPLSPLIVVTTRFVPLSPLIVVTTMVKWEISLWIWKKLYEVPLLITEDPGQHEHVKWAPRYNLNNVTALTRYKYTTCISFSHIIFGWFSIWDQPSPIAHSVVYKTFGTGGRWFDPRLYQYSFRG